MKNAMLRMMPALIGAGAFLLSPGPALAAEGAAPWVFLDVVANAPVVVTDVTPPCPHQGCGYTQEEVPCYWDPSQTCLEYVARCEFRAGYSCLLGGDQSCMTTLCMGTIIIPGTPDDPPDDPSHDGPVHFDHR